MIRPSSPLTKLLSRHTRRREFVTLMGGAVVAWPLAARAQQRAMPVVGFLHQGSPEPYAKYTAAFRKGLAEVGHVEGRNLSLNIAGRTAKAIAFRNWRPIW
jgi:hypothetical protein